MGGEFASEEWKTDGRVHGEYGLQMGLRFCLV